MELFEFKRVFHLLGPVFGGLCYVFLLSWLSHAQDSKEIKERIEIGKPKEIQAISRERRVKVLDNLNLREILGFDPTKGEIASISYILTEPAMVRIKIIGRHKARKLLRTTLLDWREQDAGGHIVTWDGHDASGNLVDMSQYMPRVQVEPVSWIEDVSAEEKEFLLNSRDHNYGHVHVLHERDKCHQFDLRLNSPEGEEGLTGTVTVSAALVGHFRGYGKEWGFGVRYYVDQQLVHEEFMESSQVDENSQSFEYDLDTTAFENGEHTIIVNMCDHNEHEGTASSKVYFNN
jgi:hypothetical protein